MDQTKPAWKSWQVWLGLAVVLLEPVQHFILANPLPEPYGSIAVSVLGAGMIAARAFSKGEKITLTPTPKV